MKIRPVVSDIGSRFTQTLSDQLRDRVIADVTRRIADSRRGRLSQSIDVALPVQASPSDPQKPTVK